MRVRLALLAVGQLAASMSWTPRDSPSAQSCLAALRAGSPGACTQKAETAPERRVSPEAIVVGAQGPETASISGRCGESAPDPSMRLQIGHFVAENRIRPRRRKSPYGVEQRGRSRAVAPSRARRSPPEPHIACEAPPDTECLLTPSSPGPKRMQLGNLAAVPTRFPAPRAFVSSPSQAFGGPYRRGEDPGGFLPPLSRGGDSCCSPLHFGIHRIRVRPGRGQNLGAIHAHLCFDRSSP